MSDRPLTVNFAGPYNPMTALASERQRLKQIAHQIEVATHDIQRFKNEGTQYATYAAAWAATLMVADIIKTCVSSMDKRARFIFSGEEKAIQNANKLLAAFGAKRITTREDVLKNLDPNFQRINQWIDITTKIRDFLKKQKIPPEVLDKYIDSDGRKMINLTLDVGTTMAQDLLMMMQAAQVGQDVSKNAEQAQATASRSLTKVRTKIMLIDSELTRYFEKARAIQNIA